MRGRTLAGALAAVAVALLPSAAYAAGGRITEIDPNGKSLSLVFSAGALPAGTSINPSSVVVTVDGRTVPSTAKVISGGGVVRTADLLIDTSGSMNGEGIAGAKAAGLAFLDSVPADVRVGLVSFAETATERVAPTTDRGAVRTAIQALQPKGETSLYDGVLLALRQLGTTGARSLIVLSDGADTRSQAPLATVLAATKNSRVTVNTVAFKTPGSTAKVLQHIAAAGGGRSLTATHAGDIGTAFQETARAIANQLAITATLPDGLSGTVPVAVSVKAGSTTLSDEVVATVDATAVGTDALPAGPDQVKLGPFGKHGALYVALLALFLGLGAVLLLLASGVKPDRETGRVRRRLSLYTLTGRAATPEVTTTALGDSGVARSAVELADRMVRRRDFETTVAQALERAGSQLKPAEWLIVHSLATLGGALLMLLLFGGRALPTLVGLVLGFTVPYVYLKVRAGRRTAAFLAQMPDTLQLVAGSLQAGYSLPQAIDAVVREGAQPVAGEFNRAIIESRLGVPVEDALEHVADRMASRDFAWVVMAIRIQREVGGNLAEVLTTVANTMRERERVRRQVKVLSAEGRLSAWILGGLPPTFALYLILVRPTYIRPLFHDPIGALMLIGAAIEFAVGVLWLRKVVQVEV